MSLRPLRFIHTSDWHLERPISGVTEAPDALRSLLCDAPYLAALRVVDAAIAENVDFLLLAGDILDVELAGPLGTAFLTRQFARLRERQIAVYWAGGKTDHPSRWPATIELPDNVRRFSPRRPEEIVHLRGETPLARIAGISRHRSRRVRAEDFWPDADGLPAIALAHGPIDRAALAGRAMTYWALGGKHAATTLFDSPHVAHYCGSPQGRRPKETGARGCTLVEIDDAARVHTRSLPTDVVRWRQQRIAIGPATTRESLECELAEAALAIADGIETVTPATRAGATALDSAVPATRAGTTGISSVISAWVVSWTIAGHGPLIAELRHGPLATELLTALRRQFGQTTPAVWSVGLELEAAAAVPHGWFERDSLLGDYLRSLAELETEDGAALFSNRLASLLDDSQRTGIGACVLAETSPTERLRVLQKAAALGAELIGSEETKL
ncbi:MAG TPA: DNA repair exonuclease [Pirellulales bacterium]|nr:DNA repair exonuclease [Pirellulales bacterium]